MKKSDCLLVLAALPKNKALRMIIKTENVEVDSYLYPWHHRVFLTNDFVSPWDENQNETPCIELVSKNFDTRNMDSFDFAVWFNGVTATKEEPKQVGYTKEQIDTLEMQDLQNQIEQTEYYN